MRLTQLGILFFYTFCAIAGAEDLKPVKKPQRRVASTESTRSSTARNRIRAGNVPAENPVELRLGLEAGFSGLSGSETDTVGNTAPSFSGSNFGIGGNLDLRAFRYVGAEAEGYIGIGGSSTDDTGPSIKRTTNGGSIALKVQIPIIASGDVKVIPKLGGGFGFASLSESSDGTAVSDNTTRLSGGLGLIGIDVEVASGWIFGADYMRSFTAGGSTTASTGTGNLDEPLNGGSFDRLRFGIHYRVAPHFLLGAQYVRRTFTIDTPDTGAVTGTGSSGNSQAVQNQGLATFVLEL